MANKLKEEALRANAKIAADKRRKAIHELSFTHSLRNANDHAEWLNGEESRIQVNKRIRAKRAIAVEKLFKARTHADRLTREVRTIHQVRLNKAIES